MDRSARVIRVIGLIIIVPMLLVTLIFAVLGFAFGEGTQPPGPASVATATTSAPLSRWQEGMGGFYEDSQGNTQRYTYRVLGPLSDFKFSPAIARSDKMLLEAVGRAISIRYPDETTTDLNVGIEEDNGAKVIALTFSSGKFTVLTHKNDDGTVQAFLLKRVR